MGWIRERIVSEYAKHGNRIDWAGIAESKIIAQLKENLDVIKQKGVKDGN